MTPPDALPPPTAADRRSVLRAAGASLALAAAAGCDAGSEFGSPLYAPARGVAAETGRYATVLDLDGVGRGVLVRTVAGHAVKVSGNPRHPGSLGATDIFLESAVLGLHDPARSRRIRRQGRVLRDAATFAGWLAEQRGALAARDGEGLRLLTGPISSPTQRRLIAAVLERWPGARWHVHAPLADLASTEAARLAFGEALVPLPDLARATCVVSFGADLLGPGPAQIAQARGWATARGDGRRSGRMPVLIMAEPTPTLTGAKADRRLALPPAQIEALARAVAAALGIPGMQGATHPEAAGIAAALRAAGPAGLVVAGRGQGLAVQALAHAMNVALGTELRHVADPVASEAGTLADLVRDAEAVTHLLVLDANPLHDAPGDVDIAGLLRRVPHTLHAGLFPDETALACDWHLPLRHPLESWGDSLAYDGTAALRQPVTLPLVETATTAEQILAAMADVPGDGQALVRATWRTAWGDAGFEDRWLAALEAGVIEGSAAPPRRATLRADLALPGPAPASAGLVAVFAPDAHLHDGSFAPLAWLQELPRPLNRLAWGNAAMIAPADAAALGLVDGATVELELQGRSLRAPVLLMPGQPVGVVTLPLGGGRRVAGGVPGGIGFDAYRLRPAAAPWVVPGLVLRPIGGSVPLLDTSYGEALPDGPPRVRRVGPQEAIPPLPPPRSLYEDWNYPGHAWGMSIDLDTCIGCNACAIACQAENNVPVVGAAEMARGRAMHWLRVDLVRSEEAVDFQPVPCMHCEKAPCEVVCPVNATVHDNEGLNLMVYPRCIGTRTCSNNCPYKVRRFNWTDYARQADAVPVHNPDVPIRPRGVIEKCTYCQHRIKAAHDVARQEGRRIRDGEVRTACQEACPSRAIHFGDINDPGSEVSRAKAEPRNYALLGHLDTRPRTTYLARLVPEG